MSNCYIPVMKTMRTYLHHNDETMKSFFISNPKLIFWYKYGCYPHPFFLIFYFAYELFFLSFISRMNFFSLFYFAYELFFSLLFRVWTFFLSSISRMTFFYSAYELFFFLLFRVWTFFLSFFLSFFYFAYELFFIPNFFSFYYFAYELFFSLLFRVWTLFFLLFRVWIFFYFLQSHCRCSLTPQPYLLMVSWVFSYLSYLVLCSPISAVVVNLEKDWRMQVNLRRIVENPIRLFADDRWVNRTGYRRELPTTLRIVRTASRGINEQGKGPTLFRLRDGRWS